MSELFSVRSRKKLPILEFGFPLPQLLPEDENERLAGLHELDLLDTPAEDRFDRIARLARRVFQAPFAMVTFMDCSRQWFKSAQGHLILETPRADSFCQFTLAQDSPLVVLNALTDPRYFELPPVSELGIRFYAGIPVRNVTGKAVGTLCVLDHKHRESDEFLLEPLEDLAKWVQAELQLQGFWEAERRLLAEMDELRRKTSIDPVTRGWNAEMGVELLERLKSEHTHSARLGLGVVLLRVGELDKANAKYGQEGGDKLLREVADRIRALAPEGSSLCGSRLANFMLLWPGMPAAQSRSAMESLLEKLAATPFEVGSGTTLSVPVSAGMSVYTGASQSTEQLLARAAEALQKAEQKGPGSFRQAF